MTPSAPRTRILPWAACILMVCLAANSCSGCPADAANFLPHDFGSINPLFDRGGFAGFAGRVVDPDRRVEKTFRVELTLPVDPASVTSASVRAFVTLPSFGNFADAPTLPASPASGTGLIQIPTHEFGTERSGGNVVAISATVDARSLSAYPGRELIVVVDPTAFRFRVPPGSPPVDPLFNSAMRFTYLISAHGPDGDPPYLADVTAQSSVDLSSVIGMIPGATAELPVVAAHSPIRFTFSEPLYNAAPIVDPQDFVGFQPVAERAGNGFTELVSTTDAGLVPGQRYCITFAPPRVADLGPLSWGTQDLSGEPIVPVRPAPGQRRALRTRGNATDVCFRAGPIRIESPRPHALVPAASGTLPLQFVLPRDCGGGGCSDTTIAIRARLAGSSDDLGSSWTPIAAFAATGDPRFVLTQGKLLEQGESRLPIDVASIPALNLTSGNALPLGGQVPPGFGQCLTNPSSCLFTSVCGSAISNCNVDVRVDVCSRLGCTLGDIINLNLDTTRPIAPGSLDVTADVTDTNGSVVNRVCAIIDPPTGTSADQTGAVVDILDSTGHEVGVAFLSPDEPGVTQEPLDDGRIRLCQSNVAIEPATSTATPRVLTLQYRRYDRAGNPSVPYTLIDSCNRPPRKLIGYDGRISAMALDRSGSPWVLYGTNRAAGYADQARLTETRSDPSPDELVLAHWSPATDTWVEQTVDCLWGATSSGTCLHAPSGVDVPGYGLRVGLAINYDDQPVMCYVRRTPNATDPSLPAGWELQRSMSLMFAERDFFGGIIVAEDLSDNTLGLGCTIAARAGIAPTEHPWDYVIASATGGAVPTGTLRYVSGFLRNDRIDGNDAAVPTSLVHFDPRGFDLTVDNADHFWAVGRLPTPGCAGGGLADQLVAFGETQVGSWMFPTGEARLDQRVLPIDCQSTTRSSPRIAARGNGDVAAVFSDSWSRLHVAISIAGHSTMGQSLVIPDDRTISAFDRSEASTPVGVDADPNMQNRAHFASAAQIHWGLPADVAFIPGSTWPVVAWTPGAPGMVDYHALLVARPHTSTSGATYDFEVVDGRVEGTSDLTMAVDPVGQLRVMYHNGLGGNAADLVGSGTLSYYREEDEDEIFRAPGHDRIGAARCFAQWVFSQDDASDVRSANAGLDDGVAGVQTRPAIDPDQCGRTTDPGADVAAIAALAPPSIAQRTSMSRFRRLAGESSLDYANRTNITRIALFNWVRNLLGSLVALDAPPGGGVAPFARHTPAPGTTSLSWDAFSPPSTPPPPDDSSDEFFARIDSADTQVGPELTGPAASRPNPIVHPFVRAGTLDPLFLALDEFFDDVCGNRQISSPTCDPASLNPASLRRTVCENPGVFERNPNPFFPFLYYSQSLTAAQRAALNGIDGQDDSLAWADFANSLESGRHSDAVTGEALHAVPGVLGEQAGLVRDALYGLHLTNTSGVTREMNHVCVPFSCDPARLPLAVLPAEAFDGTGHLLITGTGSVGVTAAGTVASSSSCPRYDAGWAPRPAGFSALTSAGGVDTRPILTSIPSEPTFGCCDGWQPAECAHDRDCATAPPAQCDIIGGTSFGGHCSDDSSITCARDIDCNPHCVPDSSAGPSGHCSRSPALTCMRDSDCNPLATARCSGADGEPGICEGRDPIFGSFRPVCRPPACVGLPFPTGQTPPPYCEAHDSHGGPGVGDGGRTIRRDGAPDPALLTQELCEATCPGCSSAPSSATSTCQAVLGVAQTVPISMAIRDNLTLVSALGCPPTMSCAAGSGDGPAQFLRPLLGHYVLHILSTIAPSLDLSSVTAPFSAFANPFNFGGAQFGLDEMINEVRVHWRRHHDGGLELQGYYEIEIRLLDPPVQIHYTLAGVDYLFAASEGARLRIRLQPYFDPLNPPAGPSGGNCDACGRRMPSQDQRLAIAQARFVRDTDDDSDTPPEMSGCGCHDSFQTDCELQNCVPEGERRFGDLTVSGISVIPTALDTLLTNTIGGARAPLESLIYRTTVDRVVGGAVLGREAAIADLYDLGATSCVATFDAVGAPVVVASRPNASCSSDPRAIMGTDTIEQLRVTDDFAAVIGRDNPFAPSDVTH